MTVLKSGEALEREYQQILEQLPEELPILPLRNTVALPFAIMPLAVGIPRSIKLVEEALAGNRLV